MSISPTITLPDRTAPILIVDDETTVCALLAHALTSAGYRVVTAADGVQALQIVRRTSLALIVLDRIIPQLDGISTARQLRANPYTTDIPLVLMSQTIPADTSLFCATLLKPFSLSAFLACVARYYRAPPGARAMATLPPRRSQE